MNARRILIGHCGRCAKPWTGPGKCCPACLTAVRDFRAARSAAGTCTRCGGTPKKTGRKLCAACAMKQLICTRRSVGCRLPDPSRRSIIDRLQDFDEVL